MSAVSVGGSESDALLERQPTSQSQAAVFAEKKPGTAAWIRLDYHPCNRYNLDHLRDGDTIPLVPTEEVSWLGFFDPVGKEELADAIANGKGGGHLTTRQISALEAAKKQAGSTGRQAAEALRKAGKR